MGRNDDRGDVRRVPSERCGRWRSRHDLILDKAVRHELEEVGVGPWPGRDRNGTHYRFFLLFRSDRAAGPPGPSFEKPGGALLL